jgi:hypothetical protein
MADNQMNKSILNLLLVLLIGSFLVLGCSTSYTDPKEMAEYQKKKKPEIRVSESALAFAYEVDEERAEREYKWKRVEVYGKFDYLSEFNVTTNEGSKTIYGVHFYENVSCTMLEEYKDDIANFKEGDQITLIGTVYFMSNSGATLAYCTVKK